MLSNLKNRVRAHLINYKGWSTKRKIVVFESDDWGAIRLPDITKIEEYRKHNSLIVDFSELHSIIANEEIDPTYNFIINNFNLLSIDNILSFIDEKLMFPELSWLLGDNDFSLRKALDFLK